MPLITHRQGALFSLLAALLFGAVTPLVKLLFGAVDPVFLGALISLGSGLVLAVAVPSQWNPRPLFKRGNRLAFAGSVVTGGALAPVLLVWGIAQAPGSVAALLLNLEAPFTVLIAWLFCREKAGPHLLVGLGLVTVGGILVSYGGPGGGGRLPAALALAGACLCWAIDNNCIARLRGVDPAKFTIWKGLLAAAALFAWAAAEGTRGPSWPLATGAVLVGGVCSGLALLVFVMGIQRLGAGRAAAFFATAPFVGAAVSIMILGDPVTLHLVAAAGLMAAGVAVLLSEKKTIQAN
ncbi:MAG: DMT family transporter [Chthoniobacteraceae bacterium]